MATMVVVEAGAEVGVVAEGVEGGPLVATTLGARSLLEPLDLEQASWQMDSLVDAQP